MQKRPNLAKKIAIKSLGIAVCICPVMIAILSYFPIWIRKESACVISGIALCLIFLALIPFYKYILKALRSPSAYMMWFMVFVIFFLLSKIADEMTVISFVGFISNLIGALIFKLAKIYEERGKDNE